MKKSIQIKVNAILPLLTLLLIIGGCGSQKSYVDYATWDRNHDAGIERSEFVDAYIANDNAKNWRQGSASIDKIKFIEKLFLRMDKDNSGTLNPEEFSKEMKRFSFGMVNTSLSSWDSDDNNFLIRDEFVSGASKSQIFSLWDTSGDKTISSRELAGGMFYVCDENNDRQIDATEFKSWQENISAIANN